MSIRPVLNSQSEINGTLIDARPKYYQVGANLIFDDLKENSNIRIFSVEGRLFNSVVASGDFELNMDYLPKGIYVVRINDYSGKIVIK
ncbi:MAG: T9SS type A sorting domain-containing protein [Muribaculaceae bacterium]|nr:T9SS type A sorting domain-containing protein [Muribaculaceae bacterium]